MCQRWQTQKLQLLWTNVKHNARKWRLPEKIHLLLTKQRFTFAGSWTNISYGYVDRNRTGVVVEIYATLRKRTSFSLCFKGLWTILLRWDNSDWNLVRKYAGIVPYNHAGARYWGNRYPCPAGWRSTALSLHDHIFPWCHSKGGGTDGPAGWPPRSPDLTPLYFHFWGNDNDNDNVSVHPLPQSLTEMRDNLMRQWVLMKIRYLRVCDRTAFRVDVSRITCGSYMERLWTKLQCWATVLEQFAFQNVTWMKSYKPFKLQFDLW